MLAARLADAEFFFDEDLKRPLADRRADLEHVVYQSELGSMAEKSARLEKLVGRIGESLGLPSGCRSSAAVRAAGLAKCDLVTHMVVEFPALQGVVGSIYARLERRGRARRACHPRAVPAAPARATPCRRPTRGRSCRWPRRPTTWRPPSGSGTSRPARRTLTP